MSNRRTSINGEALAARVNEEIARLNLGAVLAAEYVPDKERVRVRGFDGNDAVDYPLSFPWSERAIEDLRLFAKLRAREP